MKKEFHKPYHKYSTGEFRIRANSMKCGEKVVNTMIEEWAERILFAKFDTFVSCRIKRGISPDGARSGRAVGNDFARQKLLEAGLTPPTSCFYRFLLAYGVMDLLPRIRWPKTGDELLFVGAESAGDRSIS